MERADRHIEGFAEDSCRGRRLLSRGGCELLSGDPPIGGGERNKIEKETRLQLEALQVNDGKADKVAIGNSGNRDVGTNQGQSGAAGCDTVVMGQNSVLKNVMPKGTSIADGEKDDQVIETRVEGHAVGRASASGMTVKCGEIGGRIAPNRYSYSDVLQTQKPGVISGKMFKKTDEVKSGPAMPNSTMSNEKADHNVGVRKSFLDAVSRAFAFDSLPNSIIEVTT